MDHGSDTGGAVDGTPGPAGDRAAKTVLRQRLLARRAGLAPEQVAAEEPALARHALELPALTGARTVAAYVSVGREPATRGLLDVLYEAGVAVLLPVLLADNDLDWAQYEGPGTLVPAGRGLLEPQGTRLGPDAVLKADAMIVPGLAVDERGMRLGRGGGSYDRVLERLELAGVSPPLVVLLHADEVVERVPSEPHDRPVHAAVTPDGVRHFGG